MKNINNLKVGNILSESSHYIVDKILGNDVVLRHYESGQQVGIAKSYIESFLNSADEVVRTVEVTKEDKKDGTPGIRSIFENIHSGQVFTVCFKKQDKPKSAKQFKTEVDKLAEIVCREIDQVKASKKGVAEWAKNTLYALMSNPISKTIEGEHRILRGYKIQFESRDGRYDCVDMDIKRTDKESGVRPVNINTIEYLIYNGVKYVVK